MAELARARTELARARVELARARTELARLIMKLSHESRQIMQSCTEQSFESAAEVEVWAAIHETRPKANEVRETTLQLMVQLFPAKEQGAEWAAKDLELLFEEIQPACTRWARNIPRN